MIHDPIGFKIFTRQMARAISWAGLFFSKHKKKAPCETQDLKKIKELGHSVDRV